MGFSRQEHWSGRPCPPPGDLPDPGSEPTSLMSPVLAEGFFTTSATWEAPTGVVSYTSVNETRYQPCEKYLIILICVYLRSEAAHFSRV